MVDGLTRKVTGHPGVPKVEDFELLHFRSDVEIATSLGTSSGVVDAIQVRNVVPVLFD